MGFSWRSDRQCGHPTRWNITEQQKRSPLRTDPKAIDVAEVHLVKQKKLDFEVYIPWDSI